MGIWFFLRELLCPRLAIQIDYELRSCIIPPTEDIISLSLHLNWRRSLEVFDFVNYLEMVANCLGMVLVVDVLFSEFFYCFFLEWFEDGFVDMV